MTEATEHTALPLRVEPYGSVITKAKYPIVSADNTTIGECKREARATLIVRAVNAAPALAKALRAVEWRRTAGGEIECVACGYLRHWDKQHAPKCTTAIALAAWDAQEAHDD